MNKLKQLLVLVSILGTYTHATCTKQEVMKLIDKGFGKTEIASICDIQAKSTTRAKPKSKWITPSNATCRSKGGTLYRGICQANWQQAKNICRASGGRLPNKSELVAVVSACGGSTANNNSASTENEEDPNYQQCYKQKGFGTSNYYWSSTTNASNTSRVWLVGFYFGYTYDDYKSSPYYVRCVR